MKKLIALILLISTWTTAFAGDYKVYTAKQDPFYPDTVHNFSDVIEIKENKLFSLSSSFSFFQIHKSTTKPNVTWYLTTFYSGDDWLFVNNLKVLIDGKVYEFIAEPRPKREVTPLAGVMVQESDTFFVTKEFLQAMQNAKSVLMRLSGQHYYQERALSEKDLNYIKWFLNEMSDKSGVGLVDNGTSQKKPLGVGLSDLNSKFLDYFHNQDLKGVVIVSVVKNSVADIAGVKAEDVIFEFDGKQVLTAKDLQNAVSEIERGKKATIKAFRKNEVVNFDAQF